VQFVSWKIQEKMGNLNKFLLPRGYKYIHSIVAVNTTNIPFSGGENSR
jgi:hypothetical protein